LKDSFFAEIVQRYVLKTIVAIGVIVSEQFNIRPQSATAMRSGFSFLAG
jgi:hypothetical protein